MIAFGGSLVDATSRHTIRYEEYTLDIEYLAWDASYLSMCFWGFGSTDLTAEVSGVLTIF